MVFPLVITTGLLQQDDEIWRSWMRASSRAIVIVWAAIQVIAWPLLVIHCEGSLGKIEYERQLDVIPVMLVGVVAVGTTVARLRKGRRPHPLSRLCPAESSLIVTGAVMYFIRKRWCEGETGAIATGIWYMAFIALIALGSVPVADSIIYRGAVAWGRWRRGGSE